MLIRQIERFLRDTGMSATGFGRTAVQDPCFVHDLRKGREPGGRTAARVTAFMSTHRKGKTCASISNVTGR